jgi:hypothetical protein
MSKHNQMIGRRGEKLFSLLCSEADVTCNKSSEDDFGWDMAIEFPARPQPAIALDMQCGPVAALVQVKTTEGPIPVSWTSWRTKETFSRWVTCRSSRGKSQEIDRSNLTYRKAVGRPRGGPRVDARASAVIGCLESDRFRVPNLISFRFGADASQKLVSLALPADRQHTNRACVSI